jgi:S-adenosylmethionine synthetase
MVSAIGCPIDEPQMLEARVVSRAGVDKSELEHEVRRIARKELRALSEYPGQLQSGVLRLDRWPLRS